MKIFRPSIVTRKLTFWVPLGILFVLTVISIADKEIASLFILGWLIVLGWVCVGLWQRLTIKVSVNNSGMDFQKGICWLFMKIDSLPIRNISNVRITRKFVDFVTGMSTLEVFQNNSRV